VVAETDFQEGMLPFDVGPHQPFNVDEHRESSGIDTHMIGSQLAMDEAVSGAWADLSGECP